MKVLGLPRLRRSSIRNALRQLTICTCNGSEISDTMAERDALE